MRIVIITDAWEPQVNGVVRTYQNIIPYLKSMGHEVKVITPNDFLSFSLFFYREIKIAWLPQRKLKNLINDFQPDAIHIPVEGSLGWAARWHCMRHKKSFTTSFHTQFPDYAAKRSPSFLAPYIKSFFIRHLRKFHAPADAVFVATQSLEDQLKDWGFQNKMVRLVRGVNTDIFHPPETDKQNSKPRLLYVGRVAIEKNIEEFLKLDIDSDKVVVGQGPDLEKLKKKYSDVTFTGKLESSDLADQYRGSDCFVFPSKTDTFGIVIIEALACGLPVAGYNVTGPKDIIHSEMLGAYNHDLKKAVLKALAAPGTADERHAYIKQNYTWEAVAKVFLSQYTKEDKPSRLLKDAA